jgi:hypothetical protein
VNAGLFWSVLNLEHFGKVSFHHAFALFDPLKRRQADPGSASKLNLGSRPGGLRAQLPALRSRTPGPPPFSSSRSLKPQLHRAWKDHGFD